LIYKAEERRGWRMKPVACDPMLLFGNRDSERKTLAIAAVAACLFHLIIFLVVHFPARQTVFQPTKQILVLKNLASPGRLGGDHRLQPRPKPQSISTPKASPVLVPIPDPTPDEPEPIRRKELALTPPVATLNTDDFSIGEIAAPGGSSDSDGAGLGERAGPGSGTGTNGPGTGEGFINGPDVSIPELVAHQLPRYTNEAIRAKVQGVLFLQMTIRKNGKADSFQVVRGLGYGLEEKAIQEIAASWKFRPATKAGVPIDYPLLVEVSFALH